MAQRDPGEQQQKETVYQAKYHPELNINAKHSMAAVRANARHRDMARTSVAGPINKPTASSTTGISP